MEILREDLTHLFDDKGIDESLYDERVVFEDPITSYGSVKGKVTFTHILWGVSLFTNIGLAEQIASHENGPVQAMRSTSKCSGRYLAQLLSCMT